MRRADFVASLPHYRDHLLPVYAALREPWRGDMLAPDSRVGSGPLEVAVVASYGDVRKAGRLGYAGVARMMHGVGQSYGNRLAAYSGGKAHETVGLFMVPNEYSAALWRESYPQARVEVIGSPRVEYLRSIAMIHATAVVAVSFHWLCPQMPETMPAWSEYQRAVLDLAANRPVIGHAHPRAEWLPKWYAKHGIRYEPDFEQVCKDADVYVCDNSSTLFEWAATGKPVVVLNKRSYRKNVHHGGRFWEWATVGIQVDHPQDLAEAVRLALLDPPGIRAERHRIVKQVYPIIDGSTAAATRVLEDWL